MAINQIKSNHLTHWKKLKAVRLADGLARPRMIGMDKQGVGSKR